MSQKFLTGQAVILAAGESSRFWPLNCGHKSLIKIMGKPLVLYLIEALKKEGIKEILIIQGKKRDIEKELKKYGIKGINYIIQPRPLGSGEAILRIEKLVKDRFFVFNSERIDVKDHIEPILKKIQELKKSRKEKPQLIITAGPTRTPWLFGILKLKGDKVLDIVEKPKLGKEFSNLKITGVYFLPKEFLKYLKKVPVHPYSLEEALLNYARKEDMRMVNIKRDTFALKYPWDLFEINKYIFDNFLKRNPEGKPLASYGARISKNVIIKGKVHIGAGTKIFEGAVIKGPCYIGNNCVIGNNAVIRDHTNVEDNNLIGANAEVTRSIFQDNCQIHSGFFGDSIFGKNCLIGAGTITANVRVDRGEIKSVVKGEKINTGLKSFGCVMGKNVRTGIHCSFMPGVFIGENSRIGPKTLVAENVKENLLFYTKFQKIIKKNIRKS
jgi:bifunctional UDP-N-acetylglucosamine pyrophosphorylase/glucosamine-1-phosphate N-acetyltransferase